MHEVNGVDTAGLSKPINPANPLLEAPWHPWQLHVEDDPAALMQVESFASGVGRNEHSDSAAVEGRDRLAALSFGHAAMKGSNRHRVSQCSHHDLDHVAVLAEHEKRLRGSAEQSPDEADFRRSNCRQRRERSEVLQPAHFGRHVTQSRGCKEHVARGFIVRIALVPGQKRLLLYVRFAGEQGDAPQQRALDRGGR